jgi:hypothetical protein
MAITSGSAIDIADLDSDGRTEIIITDQSTFRSGSATHGLNAIMSWSTIGNEGTVNLTNWRALPTAFFDSRREYSNAVSLYDNQKSHDIQTLVADVNRDGLPDIIISSMLWSPGPDRAAFQILVNRGNLRFEDETDARFPGYDFSYGASHSIRFLDINNDGHPDLIGSGNTDANNINGRVEFADHGNVVFLNDGTGRFLSGFHRGFNDFGRRLVSAGDSGEFGVRYFSTADYLERAYPLVDASGVLTFVMPFAFFISGVRQEGFFGFRAEQPVFSGPGGVNPSSLGAPGFSEAYYLLENPDVAAMVTAGQFATGLDHYLSFGRAEGRQAFAPHSWVHGVVTADVINLRDGDERAFGFAGNDVITGFGGNDRIDGGEGLDIAVYRGTRAEYVLSRPASGEVRITDNRSERDGEDILVNVERLRFLDGTLALDTSGNAAQAFRLYQAAFARIPDAGGVGFWTARIDTGTTLHHVAASFIDSFEFRSLYGASPSDSAFVNALYQNVLGRAADTDGASFWQGQLMQGNSRAQVLLHFSESPENVTRVLPSIQEGIWFV